STNLHESYELTALRLLNIASIYTNTYYDYSSTKIHLVSPPTQSFYQPMENSTETLTQDSPVQSNGTFTQDSSATTTPIETEHLNKIRSILFGEQVDSQNQRLDQLERQIAETYSHLQTQTNQRLDSLEARLTQRLDDISQRLEYNTSSLKSSVDTVNQSLKYDISQQTSSVRTELESQIRTMSDQLQKQVTNQKAQDTQQRVHLSTLFGEISQKLNESES
ncbi:MAG: hypothetical protein AAFN12_14790, partial [Cyanobacteria bacterium J06560_2]